MKETVIGLIGASDLDYLINIFAFGRLGYTVFLLSPRLSAYAIAKLLGDAEAQNLLYAPHLQVLASNAATESESGFNLVTMLTRADYDVKDDTTAFFERQNVDPLVVTKKRLIMLHSSGSTGLPKLAHHTNARLLMTTLTAQPLRGLTTFPVFHAYGIVTTVQALWTKKLLYHFNAHAPQTNKTVTAALQASSPEIFYTVPYVLKLIAETSEGLDELRKCQGVSVTGKSSFSDEAFLFKP